MGYFMGTLKAEEIHKGWKLIAPLQYHSKVLERNIVVPTGFETDLASVPRLMRWLVPVANAKNRKAAVVHDWLCQDRIQRRMKITQRDADRVFREALKDCNVNVVGRWGMWVPVRSFQFIKGMFK